MTVSAASRFCGVAILATTLALMGTPDAYSQRATGQTGGGGINTFSGGSSSTTSTSTPTDYLTNSIVKNIGAARAECGSYDPIYRIDCLRQRLLDIARRIPAGPAYSRARQIVATAANRLGRIQASNNDHAAPRQRSRRNTRLREAKVYTAIKRQNLKKAMEQARQVIEEAQTQLLRASENSEKRASHYRQIAAAVGSTKVLLRSA